MDIVDAQIHMGLEGAEPTLASMNALGISAVLIDEYWGRNAPGDMGNTLPGYLLANGAWRTASPVAEQASLLHPDRFSYLVRVDRQDPDLEGIVRLVASTPHRRALRILPVRTAAEAEAFRAGAYDALFALAQDLDIPVFVFIPGAVELLAPYAERYPRLALIIDHCGIPFGGLDASAARPPTGEDYFDEVLRLAAYGNVALKWSHAQSRFVAGDYPYTALRPLLRRAVDAFGPQRVMWASDHTVIPGHSWADILLFVRENPDLTDEEKGWILGRSLRRILRWEAPAPT